jgi:hypothetical protein
MDTLEDEILTESEQVFLLVALLRTAKVGSCIWNGKDSKIVDEFLTTDAQVYMA